MFRSDGLVRPIIFTFTLTRCLVFVVVLVPLSSAARPARPHGRPSALPSTHSFLYSRDRFHLCRSDSPAGPLHRIRPQIESRRYGEPTFLSIFNILTFNPRHQQAFSPHLSAFFSLSLSFAVCLSWGPNSVALLHWTG